MKKFLFSLAFLGIFGLANVNAQSCSKSAAGAACCAKKTAAVSSETEQKIANLLKSSDVYTASKEADGSVTYNKRVKDATGAVAMVRVRYDEASNSFVDMTAEEIKACAGMNKTAGKACVGEGSAKAGCCSKKADATTM